MLWNGHRYLLEFVSREIHKFTSFCNYSLLPSLNKVNNNNNNNNNNYYYYYYYYCYEKTEYLIFRHFCPRSFV